MAIKNKMELSWLLAIYWPTHAQEQSHWYSFLRNYYNLPEHVKPSPVRPNRHLHVNEPFKLMHSACGLQLWIPSKHSSTSLKKKKNKEFVSWFKQFEQKSKSKSIALDEPVKNRWPIFLLFSPLKLLRTQLLIINFSQSFGQ